MFARSQFRIDRIHQGYRIRKMSNIFFLEPGAFFPIFILKTEQKNLEIFLIVSNLNYSFSHFDPVNEVANEPAWQYFRCVIIY